MTPAAHRRFLDYLELYTYFGRGDLPKLDARTFAELDEEIGGLLDREEAEDLDPASARRLTELRALLLRD